MIRAALLACVVLGAVAATPAQAQRSAADCEKISDAHAYNRCLAAAGPASSAVSEAGAAPSAKASSRARAGKAQASSRRAARPRASARREVNVRRLPSGRMRMEITAPRR